MSRFKIASWHFLFSVFCSPTVCGALHFCYGPSKAASWNLDRIFNSCQYFVLEYPVFIVVSVFWNTVNQVEPTPFPLGCCLSEIFNLNLTWYLKLNIGLTSKQVFSNRGIPCRFGWIELRIKLKFDLFLAKIELWTSRLIFQPAWGKFIGARHRRELFREVTRYFQPFDFSQLNWTCLLG